ncbi:MAG: hypothetical protein ACI9I0_001989 [Rhodoferax sp.]|jgi:hypothetical protein
MPNYQAITRENHTDKRWQRYTTYDHALTDSIVPLTTTELPKAVMTLPVGFIEQDGAFVLAAVLGLQPGKNLFVGPQGRWVGNYIPAAFRSYPFRLASTSEGQQVLCIDEDSGLVSEDPTGERFFNEGGEPAQATLDILNFLNQLEQNRVATAAACAVLHQHQLIRPWPVTLKTETGEQAVTGLFQVDEAALNQLPADALLAVRQAGGLLLAYCQLLSMQHLPLLGELAAAHAKAAEQALAAQKGAPGGNPDLAFLNQGGTINFGGLW